MIIPTMNISDVPRALAFYTGVLDFVVVHAWPEEAPAYVLLRRGEDELHLSGFPGKPFGYSAIVIVSEIDALFATYRARGLDGSGKPDSPLHQGPLDQTWGTREFAADDPDGNRLVFQQR